MIIKFPLSDSHLTGQHIVIPVAKGAKPLCIKMSGDGNMPNMYVEVDRDQEKREELDVYIIGTGQDFPDDVSSLSYLGTYQHEWFVGHVYWTTEYKQRQDMICRMSNPFGAL